MNEELQDRLVVAFERIAAAQEQQSEYLMTIATQHAAQYEKYDEWRIVDVQLARAADVRKEREVKIYERRFEFDMSYWAAKIVSVKDKDDSVALYLREMLRNLFEQDDFGSMREAALSFLRREKLDDERE